MFCGLGPQESNCKDSLLFFFSLDSCFSFFVVKKAMEVKLSLCLVLVILGSLTVQGVIPKKKNPFKVVARQACECSFDLLMKTVCC